MKKHLHEIQNVYEYLAWYISEYSEDYYICKIRMQLMLYFIGKEYYIENLIELSKTECCWYRLRDYKNCFPFVEEVHDKVSMTAIFPYYLWDFKGKENEFVSYNLKKKELQWLNWKIEKYIDEKLPNLLQMYTDDVHDYGIKRNGQIRFSGMRIKRRL